MARIFIALDIPDDVKTMLEGFIQRWQTSLHAKIKWVKHWQLHITLSFLGEITDPLLQRVAEATQHIAQTTKPFSIAIHGTGAFPTPKYPRVLWCGCSGDIQAMITLQKKLQIALEQIGIPQEKRSFSPHITLGRVRSTVDPKIITDFLQASCESRRFTIEDITLYQSKLFPTGPVYEIYKKYPFSQ